MHSDGFQVDDVGLWLKRQGLSNYAARFAAADIDLEVLPHLSDADLREIGVNSLGHRRKIMAQAALLLAAAPAPQVTPQSEQRYLTVLFCDLVDSTGWAERLGAEGFSELLRAIFAEAAQGLQDTGGHIAQYHGDGVLIYFGYPEPTEDAANNAVLAGLELLRRLQRINLPAQGDQRLAMRAGISSGTVVIDGQERMPGLAIGATVNLASRLQAMAQPNGLVISAATAGLLDERFHLRDMGLHDIKGMAKAQRLFSVRAMGSATEGPDARQAQVPGRAAFVNRNQEIGQLTGIWDHVRQGQAGLICLTGEAGMGKSRLVLRFLETIGPARLRHLICLPTGRNTPLQPVADLLKQPDMADHADLLQLMRQDSPTSPSARRLQRQALFDALAGFLLPEHVDQPEIIWCEDMHWADPSTVRLLQQALARPRQGRLVLLTARDMTVLRGMTTGLAAQKIRLLPLSSDHTRQIIRDVMGVDQHGAALIGSLASRAEGVPIYAEELASEMRQRLAVGDGSLPAGGGIPGSLQQSLQARIGRLPAGRRLLRLCAAYGRPCAIPVLRKLWQTIEHADAAGFDSALQELEDAAFVLRTAPGDCADAGEHVAIRHQIVLECAYDMILTRDRKAMHAAIGRLLADWPDGASPDLLAHHYEAGGLLELAAENWAIAARRAAAQSADAEAAALFDQALALLPRLDMTQAARREYEVELLLAQLPTLIGSSGYRGRAVDSLDRVQRLANRGSDPGALFPAMFFQWLDLVVQGHVSQAAEFARGLDRFVGSDEKGLFRLAQLRMLGSCQMFRGDFAAARDSLNRFVDIYDPVRHAAGLAQFGATDNYCTVLCCLAAIEAFEGDEVTTMAAIDRALAATEVSGHAHSMCHNLTYGAAFSCAVRHDWEGMHGFALRMVDIASDRGLDFWLHVFALFDGIWLMAQGRCRAAQARFAEGEQELEGVGFVFLLPSFRTLLAAAGADHPDAVSYLPDLPALAEILAADECWLLAECHRIMARRPEPSASADG